MKKITFAVGDLQMGGSMRVQSVIANNLDKSKFDISIFSMRKVESYFHLDAPITYAKHALTKNQFRKILLSTGFHKYILRRPVDMTVIPNDKMIDDLVDFVDENKIETLILVEQWAVVAQALKNRLPEVKLISWLHLNTKIYESFLYGKSYAKLLTGYDNSDVICVLTKEDKNHLNSLGYRNVEIMHNPVTIDSENKHSDLESKVISFVGRIDYNHKGLDYLIEIAKKLDDDWKINVAGSGMWLEEKKFKRDIKKNGLENKLFWSGAKSGTQLQKHFQDSSIFISTSRFEGFPLVFAEAMSFGLPVLSMANSGSVEVLDEGKYGLLVDNGNIEKFMNELQNLQSSKVLREKYAYLSLQRSKMLEIDKIINNWEQLLLK
jgi:glycosyltransferase involved in cell wall biosynthesis